MRRLALALAATILLFAGCGGSTQPKPHLWLTPGHGNRTYAACLSADCGPWSVTLNWSLPPYPGTTGYNLLLNGVQYGTATSSPFVFSGTDCGVQVTLGVQAHNGSGGTGPLWTTPYSSPACGGSGSPAVCNSPCTGAPVVTGAAQQGQTLSVNAGTWSNAPGVFIYTWFDCNASGAGCTAISNGYNEPNCFRGNTNATCPNSVLTNWVAYTLQPSDVGHTVEVQVTAATSGTVTNVATTASTAVVASGAPNNTAAPTVSTNTPLVGTQMSVTSTGTWTGSGITFSYQWDECIIDDPLPQIVTFEHGQPACQAIAGATSSTYTPTAGDEGYDIAAFVTATNGSGSETVPVQTTNYVPAPPVNVLANIAGQAVLGNTLTAMYYFSGSALAYTYQWEDCNASGVACSNIVGATSKTYTVAASDEASTLRVAITGTNAASAATGTSSASPLVQVPTGGTVTPTNTAAPVVSGTAGYGGTITASVGTWSGTPTSYTYQWLDCNAGGSSCVNVVAGGAAYGYEVASPDIGHTIEVQVTATNAAGSSTASSAVTSVVPTPSSTQAGVMPPGLINVGGHFQNAYGLPVTLHGADRSGPDYACVQFNSFGDGPTDVGMVAALPSWNINSMRIGSNSMCWLGLQGNPTGATWQSAMTGFVNNLNNYGVYSEISETASAAGSLAANVSPCGCEANFSPDEDHSPYYWHGLAATYRANPDMVLAPWSELSSLAALGINPNQFWNCYMHNGCTGISYSFGSQHCSFCGNAYNQGNVPLDGGFPCGLQGDATNQYSNNCYYYDVASMQQAVDVMRAAGYNGVIGVPCIGFANVCANSNGTAIDGGTWLTTHPSDPDSELAMEAHYYESGQFCDQTTCYAATLPPVMSAGFPVIMSETGTNGDNNSTPACNGTNANHTTALLPEFTALGANWDSYDWFDGGGAGTLLAGSGTAGYEPTANPFTPAGATSQAYAVCVQAFDRSLPGG